MYFKMAVALAVAILAFTSSAAPTAGTYALDVNSTSSRLVADNIEVQSSAITTTSIVLTEPAGLLAGYPGSFGLGPIIPQSDFSTITTAAMTSGVASPTGTPFKGYQK
jgi:hypothetical protein